MDISILALVIALLAITILMLDYDTGSVLRNTDIKKRRIKMIKWICLKDEDGEKIMLSMDSVDRIYCDESYDEMNPNDDTMYYITFEFYNEKVFTSYFDKEKLRDSAFEQIQIYVNLQNAFFLEIESNTGD